MSELKEGSPAPDFKGQSAEGASVSLADFKGKNVVLYFYPKDDTPGCTIEAKEFTQEAARFADADTVVIGVSYDDATCHKGFVDKYSLKVILLADTDKAIAKAYQSEGEKYAKRNTFVIGKDGNLKKIFWDVKPQGHAEEVLKALAA